MTEIEHVAPLPAAADGDVVGARREREGSSDWSDDVNRAPLHHASSLHAGAATGVPFASVSTSEVSKSEPAVSRLTDSAAPSVNRCQTFAPVVHAQDVEGPSRLAPRVVPATVLLYPSTGISVALDRASCGGSLSSVPAV